MKDSVWGEDEGCGSDLAVREDAFQRRTFRRDAYREGPSRLNRRLKVALVLKSMGPSHFMCACISSHDACIPASTPIPP